ncbi:hypothetical protein EVAR_24127_1 [Eumeta japonica]|uniref:Uncharacterized protein n=1 Tax=Eumeta variegata TaxID=151549 RepID=A0A4C1YQI1_EUMVA|nr:hypothetical protein EVAR_24127_1 [Eumeta japonica]
MFRLDLPDSPLALISSSNRCNPCPHLVYSVGKTEPFHICPERPRAAPPNNDNNNLSHSPASAPPSPSVAPDVSQPYPGYEATRAPALYCCIICRV